ncbi:MAG: hypothetical protein IPN69_06910 [Acidobacteria bacterium]|nr:hypothetical protein [Acidobacteriota bacterium]
MDYNPLNSPHSQTLKNNYPMPFTINGWLDYFSVQRPVYGGIDLFTLDFSFNFHFVSSLIATVIGLVTPEKNPLYEKVVIVFPFESKQEKIDLELLFDCVVKKRIEKEIEFVDFDAKIINWIKDRYEKEIEGLIEIIVCRTNQTEDLLKLVERFDKTAFILVDVDVYSPNASISPTFEAPPTPLIDAIRSWSYEDIWVNSVFTVISNLNKITNNKQVLFYLLVDQYPPVAKQNLEKINSIENLAYIHSGINEESITIESNISKWLEASSTGDIDFVLQEIDNVVVNRINNALIKAQCLLSANHSLPALQIIEPFIEELLSSKYPTMLITVARITAAAGQRETTKKFLRQALNRNLSDLFSLEIALQIAKSVKAYEVTVEILERLEKVFPFEDATVHQLFNSAIENNLNELRNKLDKVPDIDLKSRYFKFYVLLTNKLLDTPIENFSDIITEIKTDYPEFESATIYYCGSYALNHKEFEIALNLLTFENVQPSMEDHVVSKLIEVLENLFIQNVPIDQQIDDESFIESPYAQKIELAISNILKYISHHPLDQSMRAAFIRMMDRQNTGLFGVLTLISVVLKQDLESLKPVEKEVDNVDLMKPEDIRKTLSSYLQGMPHILLGISEISNIKTKHSKNQILKTFNLFLQELAFKGLNDESDLNFLIAVLHIVIRLNQQLMTGGEFEAISTTAAALTTSGYNQLARNFAEQALVIALKSKTETSLSSAWLAYSDIYQRSHNKIESLIGLACARQLKNVAFSGSEIFVQRVLLIRMLRDFNFFPLALNEIQKTRKYIDQTSSPKRSNQILNVIELQIELILFTAFEDDLDSEKKAELLKAFVERVLELHKDSMEVSDERFPTVLLMAQVNGLLNSEKIDNPKVTELSDLFLSALNEATPNFTNLAFSIASGNPTVNDIEMMVRNLEKNRYISDLITDLTPIIQLSEIALGNAKPEDPPENWLYLLELRSSISINTDFTRLFNSDDTNEILDLTVRKYMGAVMGDENFNIELGELTKIAEFDKTTDLSFMHPEKVRLLSPLELLEFVKSLNRNELSVLSIGLDDKGNLISLYSENERIILRREERAVFDSELFAVWKQMFPYGYSNVALDDANAFNKLTETMNGIGVSLPPSSSPLLLISSTTLQNIPPNLLFSEDNPVGNSRPMAITPSLNWLQKSKAEALKWENNYKVWFPDPKKAEDPLSRLYDETNSILVENHFDIYRKEEDIQYFAYSDITIIGAHGSIHEYDQLFRSMSDGDSTRLSSLSLSKLLVGTNIVILFVCSGGRIDRDPFTQSSIGLPFELLNQGCRTVIASSYPIDVRVPIIWLEEFLKFFNEGNTVIKSNFLANAAVAQKLNHNPLHSLALNVYGDPLLTLPNKGDLHF